MLIAWIERNVILIAHFSSDSSSAVYLVFNVNFLVDTVCDLTVYLLFSISVLSVEETVFVGGLEMRGNTPNKLLFVSTFIRNNFGIHLNFCTCTAKRTLNKWFIVQSKMKSVCWTHFLGLRFELFVLACALRRSKWVLSWKLLDRISNERKPNGNIQFKLCLFTWNINIIIVAIIIIMYFGFEFETWKFLIFLLAFTLTPRFIAKLPT